MQETNFKTAEIMWKVQFQNKEGNSILNLRKALFKRGLERNCKCKNVLKFN